MKFLLITFISITFIIFFSSTIILDTPWFNDYLEAFKNELEINIYLQNSQFITSLILASFLISQAIYFIKINGESKRKKLELYFGIFVGIGIVWNLLTSYETLIRFEKLFDKPYEIKAENNVFTASNIYNIHGISIEYYDYNKTKQLYKPTSTDIKLRKTKNLLIKKQQQIPLKISISFLILIFACYLGNMLANRKIKKDITIHRSQ